MSQNNLNKIKRWHILWSVILTLGINGASVAQENIVNNLIGSWEGEGKLFGSNSECQMNWQWTLDKKFVRLTFQNKVIKAQAFYQATGAEEYQGTWFDSRGKVLPLKASVKDSALVTLWGSPETEQGRTIYQLIDRHRFKVSDFVQRNNEWQQFGEAVYNRVSDQMSTISKLQKAFNEHDVNAMAANVTNDIKWLSIVGDSLVIEASGREALKEGMQSYFKAIPSTRSEIEAALLSGSFVAVRERAFWKGKDGEQSQFSLAVYEMRNEKIVRVWYFPAEK